MHLLVRETRHLDEAAAAEDLGQSPADLVFLSFSDADLSALAAAWMRWPEPRPGLRLANLSRLRHPMSVDLYLEKVAAAARLCVVRLIGGLDYWQYGAQELSALCRRTGKPLVLLPGDGRSDERLRGLSTVTTETFDAIDRLLAEGGPGNADNALRLMAQLAGLTGEPPGALTPFPLFGRKMLPSGEGPFRATVVFYRSHLQSGDTAPAEALAADLAARGFAVEGLWVAGLKAPGCGEFVAGALRAFRPDVVINLTAFSARDGASGSPLDAADAPVLQPLLSSASRPDWMRSGRGLSPADLAMQVVLPELDGRIATPLVAFKDEKELPPELEFRERAFRPEPEGMALAADLALGWARLRRLPRSERRIGLILSDYPGVEGQIGHAVGLDTFASADTILRHLAGEAYAVAPPPRLDPSGEAGRLSLDDYRRALDRLPEAFRQSVIAAWGPPEEDAELRNSAFVFRGQLAGNAIVAVQPDRGRAASRKAEYHDPALPPRHFFVAFYLWLAGRIDVMVHLGAHGVLEWLPGKSAALSSACAPAVLSRGMPVVYPFIVNNPGEAAVPKRRIGAVMIGHLTPPMKAAGLTGEMKALEALIDEYAAADGLDRRRTDLLRGEILDRAGALGLLDEAGCAETADPVESLARLDAHLCDVKDLQIRDGLHVFGIKPSPERRALLLEAFGNEAQAALDASPQAEIEALVAALDGCFVAPGPAGAPSRGRTDVLPTGRNLYSVDPRSAPTQAAMQLAEKAGIELLRRHLQDEGEFPRALVIDLWGSATLRTGGEDFSLALWLMGARVVHEAGSGRVTGVEILPPAVLDHPRVDVTLRISGLFRDTFAMQIQLFDQAVEAIAARVEEGAENNPLADTAAREGARRRIYGAAPASYGAGIADRILSGDFADADELGRAYVAHSSHAYGLEAEGISDPEGFERRVAGASAFLHVQDHREIDLLDSPDYAAFEGGFAAAASMLGAKPALYHGDSSKPDGVTFRQLAQEVKLIARGRAANPVWIAGMQAHGYRGAAEIARGLDGLFGFAATLPDRFDRQFDLIYEATLGSPEIAAFLERENPAAAAAMADRFAEAARRGLWQPRRNSTAQWLAGREAVQIRPRGQA
jgi:cobaltochelatase CobN